jgi:uncharacterized protein
VRRLATAAVLLAAPSAFAQAGPSFDCAKASSVIERAICKDPELAKADREMAAAYTSLSDRLRGPAKEHLAKDQVRWIVDRNQGCGRDKDGIEDCLKRRYATRLDNLKAAAEGIYPFVGTQSIYKTGTVGKVSYAIDIRYPQFEGTTADFAAVNRTFADDARKSANEATPKAGSDVGDSPLPWSYEQGFALYRPGPDAVTVAVDYYGFSGGAHGYGATLCVLIDLRTGKSIGPEGVFAAGDRWLTELVRLVGADLKKQFVEKPGFDDALEPANLTKQLRDAGRYCYRRGTLEVIFNAYDVGPYASGPYQVEIPYDRLKPLLRANGPVGR